ncbi:uncharacterized protein LOC131425374 isoform X2 [Malaya genurostris]|uniref:uncharacterized protein LOC131425374 isoform X2 n=1 Tax=Malaya genurostris TaxID=325434 RepID=UPI0026F3FB8B|nr:uncharacterized protein LOC131425374 isoform X2 [Malaya genurostris]
MSPLKYSKTWPSILTKMAMVQLRVDSMGRTFSSIVEPSRITGSAPLMESNRGFRMGHPQIMIQTPSDTHNPLPDVANVGELMLQNSNTSYCKCVSERQSGMEDNSRTRHLRSESIKIDNWDYIYTEKRSLKTTVGCERFATTELPCGDHRCISGQAALKVSTLRRHYYPEGDWGWVIVVVGIMSTVLNHGIQISGPLYLLPAGERFKQSAVNSAGK